jgi:hypothetical protein
MASHDKLTFTQFLFGSYRSYLPMHICTGAVYPSIIIVMHKGPKHYCLFLYMKLQVWVKVSKQKLSERELGGGGGQKSINVYITNYFHHILEYTMIWYIN